MTDGTDAQLDVPVIMPRDLRLSMQDTLKNLGTWVAGLIAN